MPQTNAQQALIAYVNGKFLPLEHAMVHIEDRGFQFADGVYEVVACYHGHYLDLEPHLQRLERSCREIHVELPHSRDELKALVQTAYAKNPFPRAMVYIQITRGVAARAHYTSAAMTPTVIITVRQLPQPSDEKLAQGLQAITLQDIRWKRCDIKSIAMLASVMGKQEAVQRGADEAIWRDEARHMLEGCSTNVLAIINQTLVTHPLDHQVLGGITRDMAIRLAKAHSWTVEERAWTLDEPGLSEIMISSTTNAVMPITHIDDQRIADGKPGAMTLALRQWILDELDSLQA